MLQTRLSLTAPVALLALLSACSLTKPGPPQAPGTVVVPGTPGTPGATTGAAPSEEATALPTAPGTGQEQHAPSHQYHLGGPATALVAQAHTQAGGGNFVAAFATLERAQRIEPENPLLWLEMGQVRLQEGNAAQAHSMGRKALQLASGDPAAQGRAWQLIADSLKAQGKDPESADAQRHADALVPH
jgi:predicted Zn-dependent protease